MSSYHTKRIGLKIKILEDVSDILGCTTSKGFTWLFSKTSLEDMDKLYLNAFVDTFGERIKDIYNDMDLSICHAGRHIVYSLRAYTKIRPDAELTALREFMILVVDEQFNDFDDWMYGIGHSAANRQRRSSSNSAVL